MRIEIVGRNLPGTRWCRGDGSWMNDVHVGVQVRRRPMDLVRADMPEAKWQVDVDIVEEESALDFRGPAVHGKRGDRFLYLTWGDVSGTGTFEMFRRAKLMLDDIPADLIRTCSRGGGGLVAHVDLTDERGGPRCARVDTPHLRWALADG